MTAHVNITLVPGSEPYSDHTDYLSQTQGVRVVVRSNVHGESSNEREQAVRVVMDTICHTVRFRSTNGANVAVLDWLDEPAMCSALFANLPGNFTYWGKYFPAAHAPRPRHESNYGALSNEAFDCAHCAFRKAQEICAALIDRGETNIYPTVLCISADYTPAPLPGNPYDSFFGEDGQLCFSHATTKLPFEGTGCGNCGFPGHRRDTCPRPPPFYDKVGVEIEGRWLDVSATERLARREGMGTCGDGSIRNGFTEARSMEIQTRPGSVVEQLRQLSAFYPDESDASCGMHVHVSFQDKGSFTQLCTSEFLEYFANRWEEWGLANGLPQNAEFFKRLRGDNDYCIPNDDDDLATPWQADRYRQLNFTAWDEHKTLECRLLPMFRSARLAYSALVELINIYEDWLGKDCPDVLHNHTLKPESATVMAPIDEARAVDLASYLTEAMTMGSTLEINELPPIPEGCRRVCSTPSNRATLDWLNAA